MYELVDAHLLPGHHLLLVSWNKAKYLQLYGSAMNLQDSDKNLFLKLYNPLLVYVNNKHKTLENLRHPQDLSRKDLEEIERLKEKLYSDPSQINSFVQENPEDFSVDELEIISSWQHFVKGRFYIVRFLKDHAVFMDEGHPPKAYGVKGLAMQWELIGNLPRIVKATLLPFKGKIIFDGSFSCYNLFFGSGMKSSIKDSFRQAKASYGIITSLPFSPQGATPSDAERLRVFLRSQESREFHWQEIEELIREKPELLPIYSEEMGRVTAKKYRKRLREIGIKEGWFAIIEGIIIAGGRDQTDVEKAVDLLVPEQKRGLVHLFHLKGKPPTP